MSDWISTVLIAFVVVFTVADSIRSRRESRRQHEEWMAGLREKYRGGK